MSDLKSNLLEENKTEDGNNNLYQINEEERNNTLPSDNVLLSAGN